MGRFLLALDQGTTSSRAILFDRSGHPCAMSQKELTQHYPEPGWVEHDPEGIWQTQLAAARQAMQIADATAADIAAIGITNQRETTLLWDRRTGKAIQPVIVWQDRRTAERCTELANLHYGERIARITGLLPDSYFSATKLEWLLKNVPNARSLAEQGHLAFGTVDSFLLWRLTGGQVHATDKTNASRTMLYDIHQRAWSQELLELFNIPLGILPNVFPSLSDFGFADPDLFGGDIPVLGIAGDQQAALYGQDCTEPGMAKCTYGTGCFLLMHTGEVAQPSSNRLLTTIAAGSEEVPSFALEGSVFVGGAAVQWLRDELGIIRHASEIEELALTVPDSGGVYVVPAFTGLGAPYWNPHARGAILGLTRGVGRAHIARATLESIAFQCQDVMEAMQRDYGQPLTELRVDGGASANDFLIQFQADISGVPVRRPQCLETTALGAAMLAGRQSGFWRDAESAWKLSAEFSPQMQTSQREKLLAGWKDAVNRVNG